MLKRTLATLLVAFGIVVGVFAYSQSVAAQLNPLDKACTGEAAQADVCKDKNKTDPITGSQGVLLRVTNIVATLAGVVAVVVMVVYGIMIIISYGDSGKVTQARNAVIGAAIGLVVVVLARTIVVFVVNRL